MYMLIVFVTIFIAFIPSLANYMLSTKEKKTAACTILNGGRKDKLGLTSSLA